MNRNRILILFALLISGVLFWFFYLKDHRENTLIKRGNEIAGKVEEYRKVSGRLPISLTQVGMSESEDYPLYYKVHKDSLNYI